MRTELQRRVAECEELQAEVVKLTKRCDTLEANERAGAAEHAAYVASQREAHVQQLAAAEREADTLRAQMSSLKEAHAAELAVLRQAVTDSELSRLRQQEATQRSTKATAQAERRAIEDKERAIYAAQREVGKQGLTQCPPRSVCTQHSQCH